MPGKRFIENDTGYIEIEPIIEKKGTEWSTERYHRNNSAWQMPLLDIRIFSFIS